MALTRAGLLPALRRRLHDPSDGQWSATDKGGFNNSGIRRTVVETRSNYGYASVSVVAGQHTYDFGPVFQVKAVRLGDDVMAPAQMGSMAVIQENWDALAGGTPTRCIPVGGHSLRFAPTPDAGAAGIISSVAASPTAGGAGYVVGEVLEIDEGSGGKVVVTAVTGGVVTAVALKGAADSQSRMVYDRGTGYTTGTGKATTAETGDGEDCTVDISALCKLEAYGPIGARDMGAGMIDTVASTPTAAGTGYQALDVLTVTTGGTDGQVKVLTVGGSGQVLTLELYAAGITYTAGGGMATVGVRGSGCTVNITAIRDGSYLPISEVTDAHEHAILLAAVEEAYAARPTMPAAKQNETDAHQAWLTECGKIKLDLGIA